MVCDSKIKILVNTILPVSNIANKKFSHSYLSAMSKP